MSNQELERLIALARTDTASPETWALLIRSAMRDLDRAIELGIENDLVRAIASGGLRASDGFSTGQEILSRRPPMARALAASRSNDLETLDAEVLKPDFISEMSTPFSRALLTYCIYARLDWELVLTRTRRAALKLALTQPPHTPHWTLLAAALARQCFLNEFAFVEARDETTQIAILEAAIECDAAESGQISEFQAAVYACYRPPLAMECLRDAGDAFRPQCGDLAALFDDYRTESRAISELAPTFPVVTPVTDAVSIEVRDQYEENPYPRSYNCAKFQPEPFARVVQIYSPAARLDGISSIGSPRILIAGCGTGQQVIETATTYENPRVLAVDLSRASLAMAKTKADAAGLTGITFAQGDILRLGDCDELKGQFDLIEATGCLHHLADPLAGLISLVKCGKPGAIFRIAVYSKVARKIIPVIRALIKDHGFTARRDDIVKFRQFIMDSSRMERSLAFVPSAIMNFADFFSVSSCRDLAFHVQETMFTPTEVVSWTEAAGLNFLNFLFADPGEYELYRNMFPSDPQVRDARKVADFEQRHPRTFESMYVFMAQRPAS